MYHIPQNWYFITVFQLNFCGELTEAYYYLYELTMPRIFHAIIGYQHFCKRVIIIALVLRKLSLDFFLSGK